MHAYAYLNTFFCCAYLRTGDQVYVKRSKKWKRQIRCKHRSSDGESTNRKGFDLNVKRNTMDRGEKILFQFL